MITEDDAAANVASHVLGRILQADGALLAVFVPVRRAAIAASLFHVAPRVDAGAGPRVEAAVRRRQRRSVEHGLAVFRLARGLVGFLKGRERRFAGRTRSQLRLSPFFEFSVLDDL